MERWTGWPVVLAGLLLSGGVVAEYGDVVLNRKAEAEGMPPVIFPHWFHRIRFRCKVCHFELGFEMRAGSNEVTMQDIIDGKFCGMWPRLTTRIAKRSYLLLFAGLWLGACTTAAPPAEGTASTVLVPWRTLQGAPDTQGRYRQLARPVAVAGWQDWIYIADAGHDTLYRYDRAADRLQPFRTMPLAPGVRMVAHPAGGLYITDPPNQRVLRLDTDGRIATEFRDFNLNQPVALADDPRGGRLLVLDGPYQQILAFNRLGRLEEVIHPRDEHGQPPGNLIDLAAGSADSGSGSRRVWCGIPSGGSSSPMSSMGGCGSFRPLGGTGSRLPWALVLRASAICPSWSSGCSPPMTA